MFFIVCCIKNIIETGNLTQTTWDEIAFITILGGLLVAGLFLLINFIHQSKKEPEKSVLIEKRELDLKLLESYIKNFQIIGLNGRWGTGKTFLVNKLKDRLQDQYEFIEIDLLTCNLDEMQATLINEFEELLYHNRIMPKYANKMKNNISSASFISKMQDLLNLVLANSDSNAEILKGFKQELEKLDKKIIVVYEDIDRINNPDVLKEIFAISEKIANEHIKIIYQYDEQELKNQKFTPDYLEKYIPFKMNITELHFLEILKLELLHIDESIVSIEDFQYLTLVDHRFTILRDFFKFGYEYTLRIDYIPIRKVQHLISEIVSTLHLKKDLYSSHKEFIISFYVLKHLYPDHYEKINIRESLFETFNFSIEDKKYTIIDLISLDPKEEATLETIQEIFNIEDNRKNYSILKLFNYDIVNRQQIKDPRRFEELKEEAKHKNEKIDRIIWNLSFEGKSMFTDYEYAAQIMCEDVLSKPLTEQKEAFREFWNHFFYGNQYVLDHTSIFKMGIAPTLHLFECFKVVRVDEENQLKLIDFYFNVNNTNEWSTDILECMNYSPLNTKAEYLKILTYLNELEVVRNFENNNEFLRFLQIYMQALTKLKIAPAWEYFDDYSKFNTKSSQINVIENIKKDLHKSQGKLRSLEILAPVEDLNIMIKFLDKLLEIINYENVASFNEDRDDLGVNIKINRDHLKEYDRLKELLARNSNGKEVYSIINESYLAGRLSIDQLNTLVANKEPTPDISSTEENQSQL